MPVQAAKILSVNDLRAQQDHVIRKFFNKMQREAMAIAAHDEYIVASRGTGKSEGVDARFILRNVWAMPGSLGALISPTFAKAWCNTLPAICKALAEWGYIQNVHYVVGHKAPPSMGFADPKRPIVGREGWNNAFHFWNGTVMVVLSFNQGMSANSMSLDWVIGPEAKFLDYEKIKSEVEPANRGNRQYFDNCPWHHSSLYSTDMPTAKKGKWILDKIDEMSSKHIQFIRNIYKELIYYKTQPMTEYVVRKIKELKSDLDLARKYQIPLIPKKGKDREYTVFYGEYDVFDNMEVLGKDFIWQMHRISPPLIWRTAFCNERIFKIANGFYSALDDDIHFYIPSDNGRLSDLGCKWDRLTTSGCLGDGDLDFSRELHIAFDANASICSCCIGQIEGNKMKTIKSFYVKTPSKLQDLVQKVADYYRPKLNKDIVFYFDHTFVWETGASSESYADIITRILKENGYNVTPVYVGQALRHDWKHQNIDLALKGEPAMLFPVFNLEQNEFLKVAMEQTGIRQGKNGMEKDKTPEGTPDTPDNPDEYKTHITDAWDTLWFGMNFHYTSCSSHDSGGVFFLKAG